MSDQKSEKPTPHKLKEAQKQGQVAKSQDLNFVFGVLVMTALIYMLSGDIAAQLVVFAKKLIALSASFVMNPNTSLHLFTDMFIDLAFLLIPLLLAIALFNILFSLAQTGIVFSTTPLKPDFKRLNPAEGLKKIISKKTLFELFKSIFKILSIALVWYWILPDLMTDAVRAYYVAPQNLPAYLFDSAAMILVWLALLMIPVAAIDFAFVRWDFMKKMMMSKHDVKDEHKKREGSPDIKSKQKKIQKELLEKTAALGQVKSADVVITNPTHISVALKYDPNEMISPKVVALGKGALAFKIKTLARKHNIPVLRNKKLARALYKETQLNGHVTPSFYQQLAPFYQWLFEQKREKKQTRNLRG